MANFTKPESDLTRLSRMLEHKKLNGDVHEASPEIQEVSTHVQEAATYPNLEESKWESERKAKEIWTPDVELMVDNVLKMINNPDFSEECCISLLEIMTASNMIYEVLQSYSQSSDLDSDDADSKTKRKVSRILAEIAWKARQEKKKLKKKEKQKKRT